MTLAREVLDRVRSGDDSSADIAVSLAEAVLADAGVVLALDVLDGGPVMLARAIRLAEEILRAAGDAVDESTGTDGGGR